MSAPRKFTVVEQLTLRTRKDGDQFYRMAVLEKDDKTVRELYCKTRFDKLIEKLQPLQQGATFAGGPFDGRVDINVKNDTVVSTCFLFIQLMLFKGGLRTSTTFKRFLLIVGTIH